MLAQLQTIAEFPLGAADEWAGETAGKLAPPDPPGLGIEVDRDAVRHFAVP
jgi:L-alanine-DL-glutamate epimerase-like enolase superfamily enzyme